MRHFLVLLLLLFPLLMGLDWDGGGAGFEDTPADGDQLSEADDRMREIKDQIRKRLEVEHWVGQGFAPPGDTDDNGLHRVGSARCFFQSTAPSALADSHGDYDSTNDTRHKVKDLNDSASGSGAALADDVGHGRCWIDLDDGKVYVYLGEAGDNNGGWQPVAGAGNGDYNLVYNGGFDAADGTGLVAATAVPAGWAASAGESPTYSYTDPSTDTVWGDGLMVNVTNAGTTDEGIQYEMDGLPSDSTYLVVARAKDDGTAVCTLSVSGNGGTAFTDSVTAGGGAWTTLSGTFGTSAGALDDDVLLDLETTGADTLVCSYSHVAVYKIDGQEVSQATMVVVSASDNAASGAISTGSFGDVSATLTAAVTPPRSGCIVEYFASIIVGINTSATVNCGIEEDDGSVAVMGTQSVRSSGLYDPHPLSLMGMTVNPAPGTPITYTPQCQDNDATTTKYSCNDANADCELYVKMTCGAN